MSRDSEFTPEPFGVESALPTGEKWRDPRTFKERTYRITDGPAHVRLDPRGEITDGPAHVRLDPRGEISDRGNDTLGVGKQTNPKDVIGSRKLSFAVLPWRVLCNVALAMLEGAAKYGRHNYRAAGVRASVYFDSVVARHLTQWWEGEDVDRESGLHHIDKAIAGLMVLRDSMLEGNFVDDRPPNGRINMDAYNDHAAGILDKHADKKPYHFTIKDEL